MEPASALVQHSITEVCVPLVQLPVVKVLLSEPNVVMIAITHAPHATTNLPIHTIRREIAVTGNVIVITMEAVALRVRNLMIVM
jgi:hypothetical protein